MKRAIKLISFIAVFGMFAFLQSCGDTAFYDQVYSFDDKTWDKEDTAVFKVDVQDSVINRDFILSLRTTTGYLYDNLGFILWLQHLMAPLQRWRNKFH